MHLERKPSSMTHRLALLFGDLMLVNGVAPYPIFNAPNAGPARQASQPWAETAVPRAATSGPVEVHDKPWPLLKPRFILGRPLQSSADVPHMLKPPRAHVWGKDMSQARPEDLAGAKRPLASVLRSRTLWQCAHAAPWRMPSGAAVSVEGQAVPSGG